MPKGYWICDLNVTDPEAYSAYQAFVRPFIAANDGRFLVRGGAQTVVEGEVRSRSIVIEFPSYQHALQVYGSNEYQKGMKLRHGCSAANIAIVEGFDG